MKWVGGCGKEHKKSELCICYTSPDFPVIVCSATTDVSTLLLAVGQVFAVMLTHPLHRVLNSLRYPHMLGMTNKYVVPKSPQAICYFSIFPHQSTSKISFASELCPDPRKGASCWLLGCFGDCDWVVDGCRLQWFLFVQLPSSVNKYANWNLRIVYKLIGFCCFRQTNFLLHRFTSQPAST